jgi:hypothetical protein
LEIEPELYRGHGRNTRAGKSIIIAALQLLIGELADLEKRLTLSARTQHALAMPGGWMQTRNDAQPDSLKIATP